MKINEILKEEITWADITQRYSSNRELLQHIRRAGQDPRNQKDGKIDWGSAIDLGNAEYQAQKNKDMKTDDDDSPFATRLGFQSAQGDGVTDEPSSALDPSVPRSVGAQIGNTNRLGTGAGDSIGDVTKSVGKWANDSFGDIPGVKTVKKVAKRVGQTGVAKAAKKGVNTVSGAYKFISDRYPSSFDKFRDTRYKQ